MKKIICGFIAFLLLFTFLIPLSVSADETEVIFKSLDDTGVVEDLKHLYIDLDKKFPLNTDDDQIYLVYFMEHGFSEIAGIDSDIFGLYLYIYNPSGKELFGVTDKVQFATQWTNDNKGNIKALNYDKYSLSLIDKNENSTLAKYKVNKPDLKLMLRYDGFRRYDISGIELAEDAYNIHDYTVGITYTFSGYAKGLSGESLEKSTLVCTCDSLRTIQVEANQVSYLSGNSALGVGYSNQVNSVYFSLPQDLVEEFGELYSIKYEYNHYYTSPIIVTDNQSAYNTLLSDIGKKVDHNNFPYSISKSRPVVVSKFQTNYEFSFNYGKEYDDIFGLSSLMYLYFDNSIPYLTSTFYYDGEWDEGDVLVTSNKLEEYFKNYNSSYHTGKVLGYSADLFDLNKSRKYEVFTKNINDTFSLDGYSDSTNNIFKLWLDYGFGEKFEDYEGITNKKFIEKIDKVTVFNDSEFSDKYLVDDIYINDFKNFYNHATASGENVYLLRYAAADNYYSLDGLKGDGIDGNFIMAQSNVYLNFDFIYFSFMDRKGNETIIPVASDPTDGFFNVTDTDPDRDFGDLIVDIGGAIGNSFNDFFTKFPETIAKFINVLKVVLIVILVITIIVVCFIFIPPLNNFIKGLFKDLKSGKIFKKKPKAKSSGDAPKSEKKTKKSRKRPYKKYKKKKRVKKK